MELDRRQLKKIMRRYFINTARLLLWRHNEALETLEQQILDLNWELSEEGLMQVDIHRKKEEDPQDHQRIFAARIQFE